MSRDAGPPPPGSFDDDTVKVSPQRQYGRPTNINLWPAGGGMPPIIRLIALVVVAVIGVAGWFVMRESAPPPEGAQITAPGLAGLAPSPPVPIPAPAPALPPIAVRVADEATILAHYASEVTVFRFAPNPRVLVLDFPTLLAQGRMLNRAAALMEKVGLPRDRVLGDAELDAAIAAAGDTMETFYYGHDYAAADLARFFALVDRDAIALRPEEEWLRRLLAQEGMLAPGAVAALISVPRVGSGAGVDAALRGTILRHELSHAEFFSNPAYATFCHRFWDYGLDETGRRAFRRYLSEQNYDPTLAGLMVNEMQAYLMHTPDPRMFNAEALGVSADSLAQWRAAFAQGMPAGWLRDATVGPAVAASGSAPARPRRRSRRQRGAVSTRTAWALTRTPRRIAPSIAALRSRR